MGMHAKPDIEAFQAVLAAIGGYPRECVMFEDSLKNLKTVCCLRRRPRGLHPDSDATGVHGFDSGRLKSLRLCCNPGTMIFETTVILTS